MYRKEIIYMGLFQNDSREGSAGFFKADKKEDLYRLELQIKNLPGAISGNFPIRLQSETGWREADVLVLKNGSGKWNGSTAEEVWRIEIVLSNYLKLKGESKYLPSGEIPGEALTGERKGITDTRPEEPETRRADTRPKDSGKRREDIRPEETGKRREDIEPERSEKKAGIRAEESEKRRTGIRAEDSGKRREDIRPEESEKRKMDIRPEERRGKAPAWPGQPEKTSAWPEEKAQEQSKASEAFIKTDLFSGPQRNRPVWKKTEKTEVRSGQREERTEHIPLYENKWEQLLTTYEQIHPYGDNRIYLKLEPKDFIVLRENYQHLVNNSFLLHGFYNYRYLILGKEKDFYLGVPGVFYEREKMVALMFGFEAFECEGGEAEEGKFGYYLRKVEL